VQKRDVVRIVLHPQDRKFVPARHPSRNDTTGRLGPQFNRDVPAEPGKLFPRRVPPLGDFEPQNPV
jgi:hypothetical protein